MTEQIKEIGIRLAALRDIMDYSVEEMAKKMQTATEDYLSYERGEKDFSFSFLHNAASILGVDVLDIISGESPKLSSYTLVKAGEGYDITRRAAYDYKHLAFTFRNKKAEPFLVTVEPKDTTPSLNAHEGQEMNYMIKGSMEMYLGDKVHILNEGDSIYYNSAIPHAMRAVGGTAQFLAVVMK